MNIQSLKQQMTLNKKHMDAIVTQKDSTIQLLRDSVKQKDLDVQALNEKIHLIETKTNDDTTIIEEEIQKSKLSYKKSGPFIMLT